MTRSESTTAVRRSLDLAVPPAHAFAVFTAGFDSWWNPDHHLLPGELKSVGIDPFVGGRVWEETVTGETCVWGAVLTWDPDREFAFSWLIGPDWEVPAPDAAGSRVTVTFSPIPTGTRVELVHDGFEVHGPGWPGLREAIAADRGWPSLLRRYAAVVG